MSRLPVRSPLPKRVPSTRSAPREKAELAGGDPGAAIVVRMQADDGRVAPGQVGREPLDHVGVEVGVDDSTVAGRFRMMGFCGVGPQTSITASQTSRAYSTSVLEKLSGEYSRIISVPGRELNPALTSLVPSIGDGLDLVLRKSESHLALYRRRRVVDVEYPLAGALEALEGTLDEMLSALAENLNDDVVGNQVLLDELPREIEFDLARRREADLDLLEAYSQEKIEKLELLVDPHGLDESLVAVAEVHRAPERRFLDAPARPFAIERRWFREGTVLCHIVLLYT